MSCIDVTLPPLKSDRPLLLVVAAALIDRDNKILLAQRPPQKAFGALWEFPGGKIEAFETPEKALARELKEELAIDVSGRLLLANGLRIARLCRLSSPYAAFFLPYLDRDAERKRGTEACLGDKRRAAALRDAPRG